MMVWIYEYEMCKHDQNNMVPPSAIISIISISI
jgi:hypothetical protein